jgi:apolipoprotein D and lipocalin family protein
VTKRKYLPTILSAVVVAGAAVWWAKAARAANDNPPLRVVPSVDLERYAGKWYEIARFPNRFQRNCASDTTATYTLRPDGKITVVNACREAGGRIKDAKGTARRADSRGPNTRLKVTFFWPFSGDYWIIDLDPDYRWAVVGEPGRDYLWILSREPELKDDVYNAIVDRVRQQGYDTTKLMKTPQRARDVAARRP